MAKKKQTARRAPRASTPRMYGDGAAPAPSSTPAQPAARSAPSSSAAPRAATGARPTVTGGRGTISLTQQYQYVMGDLRRLGLVALAMFAFLLLLGLVLR
jgi:hypothetical protein